jgi:hypothetical protein
MKTIQKNVRKKGHRSNCCKVTESIISIHQKIKNYA